MDKISTPTKTREILKKYEIVLSKHRGQNFLVDPAAAFRIVESACSEGDCVVEIGPGIGSLTQMLAQRARHVAAVEIDRLLVKVLREELKDADNLTVVEGDILDFNIDHLAEVNFPSCCKEKEYRVVGNLPYYVTTPILFHIFETAKRVSSITVMVQKEVAERISASPGSKVYGALSVASQYYCEPKIVMKVSRKLFFPQPEVESIVLELNIRKRPPVEVKDPELFFLIVRAAFNQRRKTVLNALSNGIPEVSKGTFSRILTMSEIEPSSRGETLSIEDFAAVANSMFEVLEEGEE
jgi:16S rRNA (adenine1518-N6/adenine1519-N6)-dimethyltransferase